MITNEDGHNSCLDKKTSENLKKFQEMQMDNNKNSSLNNNNSVEKFEYSSISNDDLSFSLAVDREVESINRSTDSDELPAFEIRLLSPLGCIPSPIDFDKDDDNLYKKPASNDADSPNSSMSPCDDNSEYVTLRDLDAQISPPSEYGTPLSRKGSLETIYEDVFLNTPPRPHSRLRRQSLFNTSRSSPKNLLEKLTASRFSCHGPNGNKENHSPGNQEVFSSPLSFMPSQAYKDDQHLEGS